MVGVFGKQVQLDDGRTVIADENYIRESILNPGAKVVAGFKPIMPTFQGQVSEESLMALVAYVKSLAQPQQKRSGEQRSPLLPIRRTCSEVIRPRGCDMATAVQTVERENYLNSNYGIKSWLLTTDHKRIAILYLISITAMFWLGGFFAMMIRLELLTPAGDLVSSDTYNKLFTMHGIIMVFFFLIPSVPAVIGNFLIPLMIGAKDLAFPRVNLLSWYLYMAGAIMALVAMMTGGVDTGWTFYTPFSTTYSNTHVIGAAIGIFITGFSSILTGLNFIVTIHRMRAPGLTWCRLPLFCWSNYATAIIMVLGTPVIAITLLLVALERVFHIGIFDPRWAAIRFYSSTCSGSIRIRRCTS